MSGRPGRLATLQRNNFPWRRRAVCIRVSGVVFVDRILAITADLFRLEKTSVILNINHCNGAQLRLESLYIHAPLCLEFDKKNCYWRRN